MKGNIGKQLQFWIGMIISLACLGAIFIFIRPAEILQAMRTAQYGYLGLTALGILMFMLLRAIRWRYMLGNRVSWGQVFHIQNIGYMLIMLLPFRIGDVARAVLIGNVPPVSTAQGVSTMVVERVLDMLFIVALLPFTLATIRNLPEEVQAAASVATVVALILIVLLIGAANYRALSRRFAGAILNRLPFLDQQTWMTRLEGLLDGLICLTRPKDGLILIVLSVLIWIPIILAYYTGLLAVNIQPTLAMAGFVVCAAALAITAPSSPGQVGVYHLGVTLALVQILGQPEAESASFALLYHAISFTMMVVLGVIGIYGAGSTFGSVIQTAQNMMNRKRV